MKRRTEGGNPATIDVKGGDEALKGDSVVSKSGLVLVAIDQGIHHTKEAPTSGRVEVGIDFPTTKGRTSQQAAVHDLDCFGDVETIPVALLECFRARDLTDEFLEADLTIGEAGFGRAVLFSCIAAIANDLGINSADHCLDSVGSAAPHCLDSVGVGIEPALSTMAALTSERPVTSLLPLSGSARKACILSI